MYNRKLRIINKRSLFIIYLLKNLSRGNFGFSQNFMERRDRQRRRDRLTLVKRKAKAARLRRRIL
jgi:hypothetical protein